MSLQVYNYYNIIWCIDSLLSSDSVNNGRCYVAPAAYACAVTLRNDRRLLQAVFSVVPLRGYMTQPTELRYASECSAVEGSVVECYPAANGS
jgi:hypothetical protein